MKDESEIIEDILDEFDFGKAQQAMEALQWVWYDSDGIPTLGQMRKRARFLMKECMNVPEFYTAAGGFHVFKRTFDGLPFYRLLFVVSEWDNYE